MTDKAMEVPIIPVDSSQWEEPVHEFPGVITVCKFLTTDDAKGKDGRTFTETRGLPRPGRTWHVEVERLDAIRDMLDGTTSPITAFMTIDMERLGEGGMRPVLRGDNKVTYVSDKWAQANFRVGVKPESLVGKRAQFKQERTHKFGSGDFAPAKDLLYPLRELPADWKFTGDVLRFKQRAQEQTLEEAAGEVTSSGSDSTGEWDVSVLVGLPAKHDLAVYGPFIQEHSDLPGDMKIGLVGPDLVDGLVKEGKLKVEDGKLALPG